MKARRSTAILFGVALAMLAQTVDAATLGAKLSRNPKLPAGADADGRVLLYTPKPVEPGSSHSHFDISASPNLLMEPSISSDLEVFDLDLTPFALRDMGWPSGTSNIRVIYADGNGAGFNDPNLGPDRKSALEAAAEAWSMVLGSSVEIIVEATFEELQCDDSGAVLARAGPLFVFKDFAGGEPDTWYSGPLAEAISGENLSANDNGDPDSADLRIQFNSGIDTGCIGEGSRYYYGLDDNFSGGELSFVTVALHEMGHGLGFVGLVDESTGELFRGAPDIFSLFTYDTKKDQYWDEMNASQRKKSAKRERLVSFDGPGTTDRANRLLDGRVVLEIDGPKKVAGVYEVGVANFGPKIKKKGVSGDLVLVDDGSSKPTFGCEALINGAEVAGKIAVIDRGDCLFVVKVKNAQNAGAKAVLIVHNEKGFPPGLGGSDSSIDIPSARIGKKDGRRIKREMRR